MGNAFSHYLLVKIKKLYMNFKQIGFLWENLIKASYINDPYGWNKISSFVGKESCYLLIFDGEKEKVFKIHSGLDLNLLLSNTFGFEFFVTNDKVTYLICFTHHDQLIGCGSAMIWIDELKK